MLFERQGTDLSMWHTQETGVVAVQRPSRVVFSSPPPLSPSPLLSLLSLLNSAVVVSSLLLPLSLHAILGSSLHHLLTHLLCPAFFYHFYTATALRLAFL